MPVSHLSLFKRSNGYWYVLYNDEGRIRWKSTGCTLKRDALRQLTDFQHLLKERPKTRSLSSFSRDFLTFARTNYARSTVDIFSICLNHLFQVAGDCNLSALTPEHLDQYKTQRLQAVSPVSVNVELRALRSIMSTAVRWNLIKENPFSKVRLVRIPDVVPSFLTKADLQKLLSVVREGWLRDVILLAVLTGMRRGEILRLQWNQVDFDRRLIHIASTPDFTVKCGKSRTIPLSDVALELLRRRFGQSCSHHVFHSNDARIADGYLSHRFKEYVRLAGLDESVHFHSLRHTFATWLVQSGVSIYEVQKLMGHSSVSVTQVYAHLAASELYQAVNRITVSLN